MKANTLYFGDNLTILRQQIPSETIDLIYLDPPFNSQRNYFVLFKDRTGRASKAQEKAFEDTWSWGEESVRSYHDLVTGNPNRELSALIEALHKGLGESAMMAYLVAMAIRLVELHRALKSTGSLYLHCDPTASHYLKLVLDRIFGPINFRNEIVWKRSDAHNDAKHQFGCVSDRILFYTKSSAALFNPQHGGFQAQTLHDWYQYLEFPDGSVRRMTKLERDTQQIPPGTRRFNTSDLSSPNPRPNLMYEYKGYKPHANGWRVSREAMAELDRQGLLLFPSKAEGRIMRKRYLDEEGGAIIGDVWNDISQLRGSDAEKLGYPTQKPLALLERIIKASSNPGDIVLDPFCGCGTAVAAAHKLGRCWLGIDITAVAVGIIKARMEHSFQDLRGKVRIDRDSI